MIGVLFLCVVASIADVDTFQCDDGTKVRVWAINGVERGEPGWREARDWLRGFLPPGAALACEPHGASGDRYVARCWTLGVDVGEAAVRAGHASACPAFNPIYVPHQVPDRPPPAPFCVPKPVRTP